MNYDDETEQVCYAAGRDRVPTDDIIRFFDSRHLPGELRVVAVPIETLATLMVCQLRQSPELTAGLRKLLEAKDCFVRAALP